MLTQQLLVTTDKPTTTTKEELIIIPIMSFATILTLNFVITPNGNCKRITIGNLIKIRINRLTTIPIKTYATTLNIIIINTVFAMIMI